MHLLSSPRLMRSVPTFLALAVALAQALAVPVGATARSQPPPLPATNEVVAEGTSAMPFDPIAWRVVRDTALPSSDAPYLERALGFAIADEGDLIITDQAVGVGTAVDQGEAAFIPEAAIQQHTGSSGDPVPYLRIGLVPPEDADYTAGGELVYAGEGFAAPDGEQEIVLLRDDFAADDEVRIEDSGYPTLILVTAGSVAIEASAGETVTLGDNEAVALEGKLRLTRSAPIETIVYAAVIRGEASATPDAVSETDGEVRVFARGCPEGGPEAGADFEAFDAACNRPIVGTSFVVTAGGQQLSKTTALDVSAPEQGIAVWPDVPPGAISLADSVPPGYGAVTVFCRFLGVAGSPRPVQRLAFTLDAGESLHCHYFFHPAETTGDDGGAAGQVVDEGRITIQMRRCPVGVTADHLPAVGGRCGVDFQALELVLVGTGIDGQRRNADWVSVQMGMAWTDLPLGGYQIIFAPPSAAVITTDTDPDALGEAKVSTVKTYPVTLTPENPDVVLQVYVLVS